MLWSASVNVLTTHCHPHRTTVLFLLVLLALQGSAQQAQNKRDAPPAGYRTNFSCVGRAAGYYADISSGCQLYHMCDLEGRRFTLACPNETLFQQRMMVCDHWYMVQCNGSELDYSANQLIGQRDKPFVSAEEHPHRGPVEFFTRRQSSGYLQQGSLFNDVSARKDKLYTHTSSAVADSGRLAGGIMEHRLTSNSITSRQDPSANRRPRNRDINTSRSQPSDPHTSAAPDSETTVYFQTLPVAYANNPFFQRFLLRTRPSADTSLSSEPQDSSAQLTETKIFRGENVELREATGTSASHTHALTQHLSPGKASDLAFAFELPELEDFETSLTQQEAGETRVNGALVQSVTEANQVPLPVTVNPRNVEQKSPQTNVNFGGAADKFGKTVQLHVPDYRWMFFIPDSDEDDEGTGSYERETGNATLLSVSVPEISQFMHFRNDIEATAGSNIDCPRCYPGFLVPGTCHPCVIIR